MVLYILLLVVIVILLLYIKKKIYDIHKMITEKFDLPQFILRHPKQIARDLGASLTESAMNKLSKLRSSNKQKRK